MTKTEESSKHKNKKRREKETKEDRYGSKELIRKLRHIPISSRSSTLCD